MIFIDTNTLVYAFNKEAGDKHKSARKLLRKALENNIQGVISTQILSEFYVVVTNKITTPLSSKKAEEILHNIVESSMIVLDFDQETVLKAIELNQNTGVHYWDCLIAATMKENNIKKVYTDNIKDFEKLPDLEVISSAD